MAQGQATKIKKKKKSVLKRAAQARERADVNRANRTRVRSFMKRMRTAISAGDPTAVGNLLHPTMAAIRIGPLPRVCCTKTLAIATSRACRWPTMA